MCGRSRFELCPLGAQKWRKVAQKALDAVLLMLSDQQMVMGSMMLCSISLEFSTITQYHFRIIRDLVYISFVVHQGAVDLLRAYLERHPVIAYSKAAVILTTGTLVMFATAITYDDNFLRIWGLPACCVFRDMHRAYSGRRALMVTFISILWLDGMRDLFVAFFPHRRVSIRASKSAEKISEIPLNLHISAVELGHKILKELYRNLKVSLTPKAFFYALMYTCWLPVSSATLVLVLLSCTLEELLRSSVFALMRIYAQVLFCTVDVISLRRGAAENGMIGTEDQWAFRQMAYILLPLLPGLALFEPLYGK